MRLFVGIDLPRALKREIGRRVGALRGSLPPARWVPSANLHLTLAFLGEMRAAARETISACLSPVFAARAPFRARIGAAGSFPPGRPARVVWLGVEDGGRLEELQAAVVAALVEAVGHQAERRPYHPHLTLGRCRKPWPRGAVERWSGAFPATTGEPFEVDHGTLFESQLGRDGAVYAGRAAYPLEGRA